MKGAAACSIDDNSNKITLTQEKEADSSAIHMIIRKWRHDNCNSRSSGSRKISRHY
jgi:hypothetical protein